MRAMYTMTSENEMLDVNTHAQSEKRREIKLFPKKSFG